MLWFDWAKNTAFFLPFKMYGEIVCVRPKIASIKDPENCNILSPDLHLGFTGEKARWSLKSAVLVGNVPTAATHKYKLFIDQYSKQNILLC